MEGIAEESPEISTSKESAPEFLQVLLIKHKGNWKLLNQQVKTDGKAYSHASRFALEESSTSRSAKDDIAFTLKLYMECFPARYAKLNPDKPLPVAEWTKIFYGSICPPTAPVGTRKFPKHGNDRYVLLQMTMTCLSLSNPDDLLQDCMKPEGLTKSP
jgi:hypothetical protein